MSIRAETRSGSLDSASCLEHRKPPPWLLVNCLPLEPRRMRPHIPSIPCFRKLDASDSLQSSSVSPKKCREGEEGRRTHPCLHLPESSAVFCILQDELTNPLTWPPCSLSRAAWYDDLYSSGQVRPRHRHASWFAPIYLL